MRRLTCLTTLCIALLANVGHAQHWKKLFQLPGDASVSQFSNGRCGYFWSAKEGLVGAFGPDPTNFNVNGPTIWYTRDGSNWYQAQTPHQSGWGAPQYVTSIYMQTHDTGFASLLFTGGSGPLSKPNPASWSVLWKTVDGGVTWEDDNRYLSGGTQNSPDIPNSVDGTTGFIDVKVSPSGQMVLGAWGRQYSAPGHEGFASSWIGKHGLFTTVPSLPFYTTSDGGLSWNPVSRDFLGEAWGSYGCERWRTFVLVPEAQRGAGLPQQIVRVSSDYGQSWSTTQTSLLFSTGDVEGAGDAVYFQTKNYDGGSIPGLPDINYGLYRSLDGGRTWKNVGGPSNENDTRFCVTGCDGSIVVAFDKVGGVWETVDGGDGTMIGHPTFSTNDMSLSAKDCKGVKGSITFSTGYCGEGPVLDSVEVLDSSLVKSGAFAINRSSVLPDTLISGRDDTLSFLWNPIASIGHDTTVDEIVRVHYTSKGQPFDTVLHVHLSSTLPGPQYRLSTNGVFFNPITTCESHDTVVTITNTGCLPFTVDSGIVRGEDFQMLGSVRDSILPGQSIVAHIRFVPKSSGDKSGELWIYLNDGRGQRVEVISLRGNAQQGLGILAVNRTSLDAGQFSICYGDTTVVATIENVGCDTLSISQLRLSGDPDFALVSSIDDTLLPPNGVKQIAVHFKPSAKNDREASVRFHSQNLHGDDPGIDTSIRVFGAGTDGDRLVAQSLSEIDFHTLTACEEPDTTVTVTNTGCDTLTVWDSMAGSAFAFEGSFPIVLKPGESTAVRVHSLADTTGHPTTVTGQLQFTSTAKNALQPIPITRGFVYPARLRIEAVSNASAKAGEIVKFNVLLEGDVPKGMSALYFDLSNDDDLLSFVSSSGVSVINTTSGTPVATRTFKLSPVTDTGVIGELTFHAYLAKASTTSLTLSNLHFDYPNLTVPPDCIASIEGSGSDFTYIYECGEGLIQKYMLGESLAIESVAPNPASRTIEVKLRGAERLSMIDVLGRERLQIAPSSKVMIDVSRLTAGTYYLRATGSGVVRTARVEVQR